MEPCTRCELHLRKGPICSACRQEMDELVEDNRLWAFKILHQQRRRSRSVRALGMEDGESVAMTGLVLAARTFRKDLSYTFTTYSEVVIRNYLWRCASDQSSLIPVPDSVFFKESTSKSLEERRQKARLARNISFLGSFLKDHNDRPYEPFVVDGRREQEQVDARDLVDRILAALPPRVQEIYRRYMAGETFRQIAKSKGLTQQYVQQMYAKYWDRLVRECARRGFQRT